MRIVIVGDVLLDRDISGTSTRLSPDGPVPVVDVHHTRHRPGGAGLVATLLARNSAPAPGRRAQAAPEVSLVTVLSDDEYAGQLRSALHRMSRGRVHLVAGSSGAPTPVKTRLSAAALPIARIDEGCGEAPEPQVTREMLNEISEADVLLIADYGRGLTGNPEIRAAISRRARNVPLVWDPHLSGADPVPEAAVVTPNLPEAGTLADLPADFDAAFTAGERLRERWGCAAVAVTAAERGVVLTRGEEVALHVPARSVGEVDPCGAGDRFAASVALALGKGDDLAAAMFRGVSDTAEFLRGGGVARLDTALIPIRPRIPTAQDMVREVRAAGGTVVATGGCFDLMHAGHARTLAGARKLGDCLIVCVNSDDSVRRLKGADRPIMTQADRAELLLSLECVDAVVVFEEDTPEEVLRQLQPDVWVKGGDYNADTLPEAAALAEWGGRVVSMPYHPGRSTTRLASAIERVS